MSKELIDQMMAQEMQAQYEQEDAEYQQMLQDNIAIQQEAKTNGTLQQVRNNS